MMETGPLLPTRTPPQGPLGTPRSIGMCILLAIVTLGIYAFVWTFKTHKEIKDHSGEGLGGGLGLLVFILLSPVTYFLVPSETKKMLEMDGRESPVRALTGFWILLPLIGNLVWFFQVQGTLNDYWASKGAASA